MGCLLPFSLSVPVYFNHVAVVDGFCPSLGYVEEERGLDRTVEYVIPHHSMHSRVKLVPGQMRVYI